MAVTWSTDRGLLVLRDQVDAMAPTRRKGSDGTKGDAAHAARESKHNPEHPAPPGNPDNQVDALDLTHDPERGADMAVVTENIRLSRDPRVNLVIFNRRMFSSYAHGDYPAWTWRPYSGDDGHERHAHIEVNDTHHDQTQPWRIGMNPADEKALTYRTRSMIRMEAINLYGDSGKPEDNKLTEAITLITVAVNNIVTTLNTVGPQVAQMAKEMKAMRERLDSLEQGPAPVYMGTASITLQTPSAVVSSAIEDAIARGGQ